MRLCSWNFTVKFAPQGVFLYSDRGNLPPTEYSHLIYSTFWLIKLRKLTIALFFEFLFVNLYIMVLFHEEKKYLFLWKSKYIWYWKNIMFLVYFMPLVWMVLNGFCCFASDAGMQAPNSFHLKKESWKLDNI